MADRLADKTAIADAVNEDIDWRDVRDVGVGPVLDALASKGYVVVRRDDLRWEMDPDVTEPQFSSPEGRAITDRLRAAAMEG